MSERSKDAMKVACLGAGYFSQFHFRSWERIEAVDLVGACDVDQTKVEAAGLPSFPDLSTMLNATKPDLLDVIVPPPAQAAAIRTALEHGIRWFICQKPFCQSLDEARALASDAQAAGATLVVHENFRFQPWYRRAKKALNAGDIGTVTQMTFRLRPGDGQGPKAYLDRQPYFQTMPRFLVHETGVHWIDVFRYLFGNPSAVYADLRKVNPVIAGEDAGYIIFDHADGVRALFDANRSLDHASDNARRTMGEALLEGTLGSLTLTGDGALRHRPFGALTSKEILPPDRSDEFGGDCVHALQNHVVSAFLNGTSVENIAREYLTVIEIKEAVYRSAQTGRKVELAY